MVMQASAPEDEQRDVPLPVTIVPTTDLDEDVEAERHQQEEEKINYGPEYYKSLRDITSQCEVFFILRSTNERDRWSGQVGLPGGRKKKDESDLEAAARETHEEIGLRLPFLPPHLKQNDTSGSAFKYIGRLNDRVITQNNRRLVVSCLLYLQTTETTPSLVIAPSEVAACGWVPFQHFAKPNAASAMRVSLQASFLGKKHATLARLIQLAGVSNFTFVRILLPLVEMHTAYTMESPEEKEKILKQFSLWGLTLGMVSEVLLSTGLRSRPFEIKSKLLNSTVEFDRVFDSKAHNFALHVWKTALESATGRPLSWEQKITSYMALVGAGVPLTLIVSTAAAASVIAKM